ncbi:unnamed protein product, partial [marine sediment metagenome]
HALLNEAVSVMEPVAEAWFAPPGLKKKEVPMGPTSVPYGGSYGEYFKGKKVQGKMKYDELFDKDIAQTFIGCDKEGLPMFYSTKQKAWTNFVLSRKELDTRVQQVIDDRGHHQPGETRDEWIDRQIEKLVSAFAESEVKNESEQDSLYNLLKAYVGEIVSAVSLSADKDLKRLEGQLEGLKKELSSQNRYAHNIANHGIEVRKVVDINKELQVQSTDAIVEHIAQL